MHLGDTLNAEFELHWKKLPAYTTIRAIIQGTSTTALETAFRKYSAELAQREDHLYCVSYDGKTLRGSFDHYHGQAALQILSAWLSEVDLILTHEEIVAKTNEIPIAPNLNGRTKVN